MLDFCAEKKISATIELIKAAYLNTAMDRLARSDVKYRFVIDIEGSKLGDD
jgi:cinnamyl-alcohol dehydrogenase